MPSFNNISACAFCLPSRCYRSPVRFDGQEWEAHKFRSRMPCRTAGRRAHFPWSSASKPESFLLPLLLHRQIFGARITFYVGFWHISRGHLCTPSGVMSGSPMLAALAALLLFITRPVSSYERDINTWTTTECGVSPAFFTFFHRGHCTDTEIQTFCYESICNSTEYGECACDTHTHDLEVCMLDECPLATNYHSKFKPYSLGYLDISRVC